MCSVQHLQFHHCNIRCCVPVKNDQHKENILCTFIVTYASYFQVRLTFEMVSQLHSLRYVVFISNSL